MSDMYVVRRPPPEFLLLVRREPLAQRTMVAGYMFRFSNLYRLWFCRVFSIQSTLSSLSANVFLSKMHTYVLINFRPLKLLLLFTGEY